MLLKTLTVGPLQTNCYVVACERTREALIIDPGEEARVILDTIQAHQLHVGQIVLTHFHFDHVLAADEVRQVTGASLAIHAAEGQILAHPPVLFRVFASTLKPLQAERLLQEGDELVFGDVTLKVLHTPGHSPGGITLWSDAEQAAFCGDTLFREGIGRTDLPTGDLQVLLHSIRKRLLTLPAETHLYPGHGPTTSVEHEQRHNPWLQG